MQRQRCFDLHCKPYSQSGSTSWSSLQPGERAANHRHQALRNPASRPSLGVVRSLLSTVCATYCWNTFFNGKYHVNKLNYISICLLSLPMRLQWHEKGGPWVLWTPVLVFDCFYSRRPVLCVVYIKLKYCKQDLGCAVQFLFFCKLLSFLFSSPMTFSYLMLAATNIEQS